MLVLGNCVPKREDKMVAPYSTATVQNNNKCPHGLPVGACPICSGMGGGASKDKNKPRVAGEMSYNECMAAWIKIQAAKEAKIQAQIERIEQSQAQLLLNRAILGLDKAVKQVEKLIQQLDSAPKIIAIPAKIILNIVVKPILNLISKIPQAINNIQTFFSNITRFIASVSEKLASIYGEIKNFIDAKISQPIKKAVKSILSLFVQTKSEDSEDEEVKKLKSRELKKILKGLFRIKNKAQEEQKEK